jgi:hypothetical protein
MKKLILSALFAILVSLSTQASASAITTALQAAINSNNFAQIDSIAAANPAAQGEIAMYLLQQAQAKMATNPDIAARIFAAAAPFVAQIPSSQAADAASIIASIVSTASGAGFESSNPGAASSIFEAALGMTNQPNILASNPNLHATVLAGANTFLEKNPQGADKKLQDIVSLAQAPGAPPTVNALGAYVPSAE